MKITQDSKTWRLDWDVDPESSCVGVDAHPDGVVLWANSRFPTTGILMALDKSQLKSLITFLQKQL